jgi:hypothetical protein
MHKLRANSYPVTRPVVTIQGRAVYLRPPLPLLDTISKISWRACSHPSRVPTISMASSLAWSRGTWILVPVFFRRSLMVLPPEPTTSLVIVSVVC